MHATRPSLTAAWVATLRGLGAFETPVVAHDPFARGLLPVPYSLALGLAEHLPKTTKQVLAALDAVSSGRTRHLTLRTRAIDDAVHEALDGGARQVVLLGAGLDTRAQRVPDLASGLAKGRAQVFEVDHPATQAWKRRRLARTAGARAKPTFVAVDLETDALGPALAGAGLASDAPAVVVWEGVVMYLTPEAIDRTLGTLARLLAPGSTLVASYLARRTPPGLGLAVRLVREPFRTVLAPADVAARLATHGFDVASDASDPEWQARYLGHARTTWASERVVVATRRGS